MAARIERSEDRVRGGSRHADAQSVRDKPTADAARRRSYVTDWEDHMVSVVSLGAGRTVAAIRAGAAPHGLRLRPDECEAWVANVGSGSVSVVDLGRGAETARIPVGPAPVQVGCTPDSVRAFVSLRDADAVAEVDVDARCVVRRIPVGRSPIQVYVTPDGRLLYVANEGTREDPGRTASVIDIAAGAVATTVETGRRARTASSSRPTGRAPTSRTSTRTRSRRSTSRRCACAALRGRARPQRRHLAPGGLTSGGEGRCARRRR